MRIYLIASVPPFCILIVMIRSPEDWFKSTVAGMCYFWRILNSMCRPQGQNSRTANLQCKTLAGRRVAGKMANVMTQPRVAGIYKGPPILYNFSSALNPKQQPISLSMFKLSATFALTLLAAQLSVATPTPANAHLGKRCTAAISSAR